MKFVEQHLTRHHLFRKPHKWFLAFLASPVHAAEVHYKRKYHLTFAHAKKLFLFDMTLLLSTIFLVIASVLWYTYDPTVLELVSVSIDTSEERIQSGDYATYTFSYANQSDITLTNAAMAIQLPEGFELDTNASAAPSEGNTFSLADVIPGAEGALTLAGWFYDVPNVENTIVATLSYTQDGSERTEVKARQALTTLRGSVLDTALEVNNTMVGSGTTPITITLTNTGERPLNNVQLPLQRTGELAVLNPTVSKGTAEAAWNVGNIDPDETVTLSATLQSRIPKNKQAITLLLTPTIEVNNTTISQQTLSTNFDVAHPAISIESQWQNDIAGVPPGTAVPLDITVANTGDTLLTDLRIDVPLPEGIISRGAVLRENTGTIHNGNLRITSSHNAALSTLAPQDAVTLTVALPILVSPRGTDVQLSVRPQVTASVPAVPQATFTDAADPSPAVKIGSRISLSASARYYSNEGDQLGRGPLPPQVGKETKYWAVIALSNASSQVQDVQLSARLPDGVVWTGKTSVSHGAGVQYTDATRSMNWRLNTLAPYQTIGIYAELSVTPTAAQRGTTPLLLENIQASATDSFIGIPLSRSQATVDASLTEDTIGQAKGTQVR